MTLTIPVPPLTDQTALLAVSARNERSLNPFAALPGAATLTQALELDFAGKAHRWAVQLDDALLHRDRPVIVVAHGVSCLAVAWWAQLSPRSYLRNVTGAVLLSPLSFTPSEASAARTLRPSPGTKLPFPSIVASATSPIIDQVLDLADSWGSRFIETNAQKSAPWLERSGAEEALWRTFEALIGPQPALAATSWWNDDPEPLALAPR